MLTSKDLRKQHLEQSLRPAKVRKVSPIVASKKIAIEYNATLQRLVAAVKKAIEERIIPLLYKLERDYVSDSWDDDINSAFNALNEAWTGSEFTSAAERTATEFVESANRLNQRLFREQMQKIGIDVFGESPKLADYLEAAASENVRLIKSIPSQYLDRVRTSVVANMRAGRAPGAIVSQIREQYGVTQARAKLIARDQTAKINSELNERRQRETGFEYFQWVTSKDERVRHDHQQIANQQTQYGKGIYRWDDPPKDSKGKTLTPGSDFQCRCTARPMTKRMIERQQQK